MESRRRAGRAPRKRIGNQKGNSRFLETPLAEELDNTIKQNATGPRKASGDAGAVEQHSLADQIAADKHLASKQASRARGLGVKLAKLAPGGTV